MGRPAIGVVVAALVTGSIVMWAGGAESSDRLPLAKPLVVSTAYRHSTDRLGRNETLSHMFDRQDLRGQELLQLLAVAREDGLDPRRVRSDLIFEFRWPTGAARPDRIRARTSTDGFLTLTRDTAGVWSSEIEVVHWTITEHAVEGVIENSLNQSVHTAISDDELPFGERDRLIWNVAEAVYGWVIDFNHDPRPGDRFRMVYERLQSDVGDVRYGRLLAADIEIQGSENEAYVLTDAHGNNVYYDDEGRSLHRAFMKYPVNFQRISGVFSSRRFHPVLQRYRAHLGYDFAADQGTPIRATGNGVVDVAGRNGGYGLMVAIRHPKGIETRYAHMSRIASGIRSGTRVEQGQTIGYVGMTGLATGPHVHYEFLKNGRQVNYRNLDLGEGEPLPDAMRGAFDAQRLKYLRLLFPDDAGRLQTLGSE